MNKQGTTIPALDIATRAGWAARTPGGGARDADYLAAISGAETTELMPGVTIANPGQWRPATAADINAGSQG